MGMEEIYQFDAANFLDTCAFTNKGGVVFRGNQHFNFNWALILCLLDLSDWLDNPIFRFGCLDFFLFSFGGGLFGLFVLLGLLGLLGFLGFLVFLLNLLFLLFSFLGVFLSGLEFGSLIQKKCVKFSESAVTF